jgi:hypothetical protein
MVNDMVFEPDDVGCSGDDHRAMIEVVTFTEVPDSHFSTYVNGNIDKVVGEVKKLKESASPSTSLYVSWCCKQCEEAANG